MAKVDIQQLRMQYEILNKPLQQIADDVPTPVGIIEKLAEKEGWRRWFPEPDMLIETSATRAQPTPSEMEDATEEFVKRTKQRLAMYSIVKDMLLAQKYLALESRIIDEANDLIDQGGLEARDVKALSALYAEMTKTSLRDALASFTFGDDSSGLPTVIFKNMAGKGVA